MSILFAHLRIKAKSNYKLQIWKVKVAQSCPTLWPHGLNSLGQNIGVGCLSLLQGMKPRSPALQADSLRTEPQGMPYSTGGGSLSLLQWIFPIQELSQGLLHCRRIFFYQLKYQGSPLFSFFSSFQVPIFWEKGGRSSLQSGLLCLRSTKAQLTDYTPQLCLSWPPRLHWLYHELGLPLYCKVMTDFLM